MNKIEFDKLSLELQNLARSMPLKWGNVQNNSYDSSLNFFQYNNHKDFEDAISNFDEHLKNYFRRRWFIWQCSKCDEYLFYKNDNVEKNPNPKDKEYDILINNAIKFDVKGTVIPKSFRGDIDGIIDNPQRMINFFYEQQSKGVRYDIQNRLFIIHHSFIEDEREMYLRCTWSVKEEAYRNFVNNIGGVKLWDYNGKKVGIIYILERKKGEASYLIQFNK